MFCILLKQTQFQCSHMTCFGQYGARWDLSNEESHLDHYCQMFCILLEQTQFQCSHMTCLVSMEPDETSQIGGLTWINTVICSAYCLNKISSSVLTLLVLVSMEPDETSQMRSLTWINTVRCSAYCLNKLSSSVLT